MIRLLTIATLLLAQSPGDLDYVDEGFDPFLCMFLLMGLLTALILTIIGVVTALIIAATGGFVVLSGAALSSTLAALLRRSPSLGLTLFIVQVATFAGGVFGVGVGMLYSYLHNYPLWNIHYTGLACAIGALANALCAWLLVRVGFTLLERLRQWWVRFRAPSYGPSHSALPQSGSATQRQ